MCRTCPDPGRQCMHVYIQLVTLVDKDLWKYCFSRLHATAQPVSFSPTSSAELD